MAAGEQLLEPNSVPHIKAATPGGCPFEGSESVSVEDNL